MVNGNALRVALVTLCGACAVSGGVVILLPKVLPPDGATASRSAVEEPAALPLSTPEAAALPVPSFDTVRMAPDGSGLVAGQAEPGAVVDILAGEQVAARVTADADGRFAAFLDLPPSDAPLLLALRDRAGALSEESVILAPTTRAMAAQVEPSPPSDMPPGGAPSEPVGSVPASGDSTEVASVEPSDAAPGPSEASPPGPKATAPDMAQDRPDGAAVAAGPVLPLPTPEDAGQPPVLLSDAEGVRVLQPALPPGADPEVLDTVALDAIVYDGTGAVTVSGRGAGGGAVRIYLDNEAVAEGAVDPDGQWSADLAGTAPGVYTLRVDHLDSTGEVVSRIETPFQREERADIAAALSDTAGTSETITMRTVQPGNTLWAIARERYGEPMMYVRVVEANQDRIRNPDLIYPGQVFVLPQDGGI